MTTNQHVASLLILVIFTFQAAILYHKSEKKINPQINRSDNRAKTFQHEGNRDTINQVRTNPRTHTKTNRIHFNKSL